MLKRDLEFISFIHLVLILLLYIEDTVMAPSKAIFEKVIQQLEGFMQLHSTDEETSPMDTEEVSHFDGDADHHVDLIEFPSEGTNVEIFFWLALSPLRFAMHYTIPDVRQLDEHGHPKTSVGVAFMSTLMCLVWLILGSYAMVTSLEDLAELLSIPDAVVGVTVSAAGKFRMNEKQTGEF